MRVADAVLRLEGIRKSYNTGTPVEAEVLHGIDLELGKGELCALMGPSGSGKSTLLNIMGLLDHPTGGRVFMNREEATRLDERALTRADVLGKPSPPAGPESREITIDLVARPEQGGTEADLLHHSGDVPPEDVGRVA